MTDSNDIYDAKRCRCCGKPWSSHTDECPRHAFRPNQPDTASPRHLTPLDHATAVGRNGHPTEAATNA